MSYRQWPGWSGSWVGGSWVGGLRGGMELLANEDSVDGWEVTSEARRGAGTDPSWAQAVPVLV